MAGNSRSQSGASRTPVTHTHLAALEAQNKSEYQQTNIAGDFGTYFWVFSKLFLRSLVTYFFVILLCKLDYMS